MKISAIPETDLHAGNTLMQSPRWARIKKQQGFPVYCFKIQSKRIEDTLLCLMQRGPGDTHVAYFPWSPRSQDTSRTSGELLEEISETVMNLVPENTLCLRFDVPWESPYKGDTPDDRTRNLRMNFGTSHHALRKAPTDIQPTATIELNLRKTENELLREMKPKTRYNIGLSSRRGVRIRFGSPEEIESWYHLYAQTMSRQKIPTHPIHYFTSICKQKICCQTDSKFYLLLAEHDKNLLAGMFLGITGNRATYLYGASSDTDRRHMPTYALQWHAIRFSKSLGCTVYDLFGVPSQPSPSHPMYGLYQYKHGFGGKTVYRRGCWDYPLLDELYHAVGSNELSMGGYHQLRDK